MTLKGASSEPALLERPNSGTSDIIRKTTRTSAVQKSFSLNRTLRSGAFISGIALAIGLNNPRNLPAMI
jgi:hypothetical protein